MDYFSKEDLIEKLKKINKLGWIANKRPGNAGGVGNTLEDLLGITENNLPIPNAAEWELKCQREGSSSLTTLFHFEPSPRAAKFVPTRLLPLYGWKHETIAGEMSFRQTINGKTRTDRGFKININRKNRKVLVSFEFSGVGVRHSEWLKSVEKRAGLGEINPQPYWGFDDLANKAGTKLLNCFYIKAKVKREDGKEYYWYTDMVILRKFSFENFLRALEDGFLFVDFDARTNHNHGTKFRLKQDMLPRLYEDAHVVIRGDVVSESSIFKYITGY